ncbi:carboxypeptidase B-like [Dreissena polymorpha]|uniref:Peptidase M14 domain-containing protein n=1 Tax=Dreissena polymorpha TaxID=45954 RepID=A0A9D4C010_DREPO|nr:carboxypeptidase B-like [Dreissena polymorpha]KAH3714705.1 hypothetical protein DPMN_057402 [Dreissena polymorpha]
MLFSVVFLLPVVLCAPSPQDRYDGHKVLEIFGKTEEDFRKLLELQLQFGLDMWKTPKHVNDSAHAMVAPEHLTNVLEQLNSLNLGVSTLIDDVQQLIHSSTKDNKKQARAIFPGGSGHDHGRYYRHQAILDFMTLVANDANKSPNVAATLETIGTSGQGRSLKLIKIFSTVNTGTPKRKIFIDGGIHAREWISPASVKYLIEQFAYNPGNIADIYTLLARYEIYLIPVMNPDGYEFSHTNTRMWRKNRRTNTGSTCIGVDLNRNFPYQWNPANGGSTNPCQDTYSGTGPASEVETQVLVNYLTGAGFDAYITIHSYGQYWLYPWGFTTALPADVADLHAAGQAGVDAIQDYGRLRYTLGSSTNVLYAAAGGSDDFAKGMAGVKYSYTLELRDNGRYGFLLPESEIIPACEELRAGFLAFANAMYNQQQVIVGK